MGTLPGGQAGAPHEPSAAQAHGDDQKSKTIVIFINQIRMQIGVMFGTRRPRQAARRSSSIPLIRLDIRRIALSKNATR